MFLGIEISDRKIQLGVGDGLSHKLVTSQKILLLENASSAKVLEHVEVAVQGVLQKYTVQKIGVGFHGAVDVCDGQIVKSLTGDWNGFPLSDWMQSRFNIPAIVEHDYNCATLAEAHIGAGKSAYSVFYVSIGSEIRSGFAADRELIPSQNVPGARTVLSQFGQMRPGPQSHRAEMSVESIASGTGIANAVRARIAGMVVGSIESIRQGEPFARDELKLRLSNASQTEKEYVDDILMRCENDLNRLDAKTVGQAALEGNEIACWAIEHGISALGWAIAQVITLVAPEVITIDGGVPRMGKNLFWSQLRKEVKRYILPTLKQTFEMLPARTGSDGVMQGAIILARQKE